MGALWLNKLMKSQESLQKSSEENEAPKLFQPKNNDQQSTLNTNSPKNSSWSGWNLFCCCKPRKDSKKEVSSASEIVPSHNL